MDSDEDEDEDDTDELLRELEKIKRERAEEKARQEREQSATDAVAREAEIATANPLLNLAAALGQQQPQGLNTTAPGSFAVKRRWDDGAWWPLVEGWAAELTVLADLIFKNQAMDTRDKNDRGFVNDLLRTEFHKCVLVIVRILPLAHSVAGNSWQSSSSRLYTPLVFYVFSSLHAIPTLAVPRHAQGRLIYPLNGALSEDVLTARRFSEGRLVQAYLKARRKIAASRGSCYAWGEHVDGLNPTVPTYVRTAQA